MLVPTGSRCFVLLLSLSRAFCLALVSLLCDFRFLLCLALESLWTARRA